MTRFGILLVVVLSFFASPAAQASGTQTVVAQASTAPTAVVERGEGLSQFSLRVLGTSKRWREIFRLNSDRIADANLVFDGMVLRLPGPALASSGAAHAFVAHAVTEARILPGEGLSQFSLRVLGTCKLWPQIYAWNRDRVSSPDQVEKGTLLRLSEPTSTQASRPVAVKTEPVHKVAERKTASVVPAQPVRPEKVEDAPEKAIITSDISPDVSPDVSQADPAPKLQPYGKMELPF